MKISIIGPGLMPIPPKGWGAVESLIWDMANALKDLGQEVQIINTTDPNKVLNAINEFNPDFVHINYDDFINAKNVVYSSVSADAVHIFVQFNKEYGGGGV